MTDPSSTPTTDPMPDDPRISAAWGSLLGDAVRSGQMRVEPDTTPTTGAEPIDLDAIERQLGGCNCEDNEAHDIDCRAGHNADCPPDCYSEQGCPRWLLARVRELETERDRLRGELATAKADALRRAALLTNCGDDCELLCDLAVEHAAAPATWTPCEADLDHVAAAGKAGHLVERRPSGALACSCGCVAGGWPGMLGHLEDDVSGPLSATPPEETGGCRHHRQRCEVPNALCLVDCTPATPPEETDHAD